MKKIKIQVNHGFADYDDGEIVEVEAHETGEPVELFWRRRLRDAKTDRCCEVVQESKKSRRASSDGGEE